ncbi:hypothetical protein JR316_0005713 [Psilocybe cubensis]|uniref:Uncharacterized protein n=2 Tax=Psilocybe cubensis TaxID=181762 RepID=A0ACB8GZX6_PSICU|nr:hypothetical protein JR316_0005713 [Psilocybe cubensis]KAH9481193.1 hypothetical protein JR316_0005713 [Psilocybe cubensis]
MAAVAQVTPAVQAPQLCDYCHQKPKFSNHSYCSKTCAGQAATMCNQCHKKPKFQNFEYCGKNCAASAAASGKPRNPTVGTHQAQTKANNAKAQQQGAPAFDPIQLAKLVAQHIPQVQALINPNVNPAGHTIQTAPTSQPIVANPFANPAPQVIPPAIHNPNAPVNNPFLNNVVPQPGVPSQAGSAQNAVTNGAVILVASSNLHSAAQQLHLISTQQSADDTECLIPGCGQPVHVDSKGVKVSDYCSMRHREEAVATGLASPCIMCLTLPQSDTDYFCSRGCREESLNKHLEYKDDGVEE